MLRKRGKVYHFRGTIPARQADGRITRVRHEESLRTEHRKDAIKKASDLERYYHDLAYGNIKPSGPTFAQVAESYIITRGKSDWFITQLIKYFGETPIDQIDQQAATKAAQAICPSWKQSSIDRAVWTPLSAILRLAGRKPDFTRPIRKGSPKLTVPDEAWFDRMLDLCEPRLGALIQFLTLTGRRCGEAISLTWGDIDGNGMATIARTKTGVAVRVSVPSVCIRLLGTSSRRDSPLFGFKDYDSARSALRYTCKKHGLPYYSFHKLGRHSFATRAIKAGKTVSWLTEAGGWASPQIPLKYYVHLEHTDVQRDMKEMGEEWTRKRKPASRS